MYNAEQTQTGFEFCLIQVKLINSNMWTKNQEFPLFICLDISRGFTTKKLNEDLHLFLSPWGCCGWEKGVVARLRPFSN